MQPMVTKLAWLYAAMFLLVVALGYVPGLTNADGQLLGLFKIDPIDDVVHLTSGLAAAATAWYSANAARWYFRLFGLFYTTDAIVGLFTGLGTLDVVTNVLINLPHLILGPAALAFGLVLSPKPLPTDA